MYIPDINLYVSSDVNWVVRRSMFTVYSFEFLNVLLHKMIFAFSFSQFPVPLGKNVAKHSEVLGMDRMGLKKKT